MLLQQIIQNSKKIFKLDSEILSKITSDTNETANALIVVSIWSTSVLYFSFNLRSSALLYPAFDHIFGWIIATFGTWYFLSKVYNETLQMQNLLALTGYAQVVLFLIIFLGKINFCFFPLVYCSGDSRFSLWMLGVVYWVYAIIYKGMKVGFYIENKPASSSSILFLVIIFLVSDILKSLL